MENYSYNSYPDSHDSSPRSREIDSVENASWTDEQQLNYKVKFMCSYGGKIQPRPHDNQLTYVGGDTKILSVDRNIKFAGIVSKLSSLCDFDVYFKYQLPGEDLDALISVTNDEDLEHMMIEYDRLLRGSTKPARLRLFLFSLNPSSPSNLSETSESNKTNQSWFVDALNSVPIQSLDVTSPPAPPTGIPLNAPDFLFGFDKGQAQAQAQVHVQSPLMVKQQEPERELPVPEQSPRKNMSGSDSGKDDRQIGGETTMVSRAEIQRQIGELQRMQIANANHEQAMFQRQTDEMLARAFPGDYFMQQQQQNRVPEKIPAMAAPAAVAPAIPVPSPVHTVPTPTNITAVPTGYWQQQQQQDRHVAAGGYPVMPTGGEQQHQQQRPVYLVPAPTSMYQTQPQPVTGQVGQGYYGMQRMMQDVYREQPVYGMGPPPPPQQQQQQQTKMVGGYGEGVSIVRPPASGIPVAESGYTQMAYDSAGRQVYYNAAPGGGVVPTSFQTVPAVDGRQAGGQLTQEGKVLKPNQPQI